MVSLKLKPLSQQVIVITGASSGIGLATAQAAARQGAKVVLFSRDEDDLGRAAAEIRADGGEVAHAVGDVADFEAMKRLADTAMRAFGRIDTWVNNAGVSIYGPIVDVPIDDARRLFETNYWGVVHGSLVARYHLASEGGALVNLGSALSETGYPLQGHYAASKHAVKGFTDSLRLEVENAGDPISVTLVEPAAIDTPYPEHARNYLGVEPKHEPPVYAPEIVASAILDCAVRPQRLVRVGGGAELMSWMERVAPGLADRQKMTAFEGQRTMEPARDDDTLFAPRPGDGRVHGSYPGHVIASNSYDAIAKHSSAAIILGAAAVGVGLGLAARRLFGERAD